METYKGFPKLLYLFQHKPSLTHIIGIESYFCSLKDIYTLFQSNLAVDFICYFAKNAIQMLYNLHSKDIIYNNLNMSNVMINLNQSQDFFNFVNFSNSHILNKDAEKNLALKLKKFDLLNLGKLILSLCNDIPIIEIIEETAQIQNEDKYKAILQFIQQEYQEFFPEIYYYFSYLLNCHLDYQVDYKYLFQLFTKRELAHNDQQSLSAYLYTKRQKLHNEQIAQPFREIINSQVNSEQIKTYSKGKQQFIRPQVKQNIKILDVIFQHTMESECEENEENIDENLLDDSKPIEKYQLSSSYQQTTSFFQ